MKRRLSEINDIYKPDSKRRRLTYNNNNNMNEIRNEIFNMKLEIREMRNNIKNIYDMIKEIRLFVGLEYKKFDTKPSYFC